ncbi:MAG: hypothetical protein R2845_16180 [Thermomicrobiales bacterium]
MLVLGGWLFADLLLGLAMLFLAANTFGTPPPEPTPTATPNLLATSEANVSAAEATIRAQQMSAQEQATANALISQQQTATAIAEQTREAMSEDARATSDAQATQDAIEAAATVAAFATEMAENELSVAQLEENLAAAAAQATQDAAAAQATIDAISTQQAEAATVAAQNEESGANAIATANAQATEMAEIAAIATQNAESGANDLATAQAEAAAAIATSEAILSSLDEDALATAEAQQAVLQQTVEAQSTQLAAFANGNAIEDDSVNITVNIDANGLIGGSNTARENAIDEIDDALQPYSSCQAVVVLTYGHAGSIGTGQQIAQAVNNILTGEFSEIFEGAALKDYADVSGNVGQVDMEIFFRTGCVPG